METEPVAQRFPYQRSLFGDQHLFGFGWGQLVHGEAGGDRRDEQTLHPVGEAFVQCGKYRLPYNGQAVEPSDRLHHDIRRDDIFLEIMQQGMSGMDEFGP